MVLWNYIGSKYRLLPELGEIFDQACSDNSESELNFVDLFAGTGCVSNFMCSKGYVVSSNDVEYYSYVLNRGYLTCAYEDNLEAILADLNTVTPVMGPVTQEYATTRLFFTPGNAMIIDAALEHISTLYIDNTINENEYYYLLSCIIESADRVANIASVYGAYLKQYKPACKKKILFEPIHTKNAVNPSNSVSNFDCFDFLRNMSENGSSNILYLDPPYNKRQYGSNYHVLNYICKIKNPLFKCKLDIYGVTGLIKGYYKSSFCKKKSVFDSFTRLFELISEFNSIDYVVMSYSNEGYLDVSEILGLLVTVGKCCIYRMNHKKFTTKLGNKEQICEYVFVVNVHKKHETNKCFMIDI